jgi:hypothetical protein
MEIQYKVDVRGTDSDVVNWIDLTFKLGIITL